MFFALKLNITVFSPIQVQHSSTAILEQNGFCSLNLTAECFKTHSKSWGYIGRSCGQRSPLPGNDNKMGWDGSRFNMEKGQDFARCWVALLQILVWVMSFCLLVKVVGHREQPASTSSPATGKEIL